MQLPLKLGIAGGSILFIGTMLGFVITPALLKSQVKKAIRLEPGGETRSFWEKIPFTLDFKMYIWNVTNHEEVEKGGKPKLQEVGPFFFQETREKVNLEDFEEDDEVEFNTRITFHYDLEASNGLTGEEEVIMPHMFILTMFLSTIADKPKLAGLVGKAVDSIFNKPESIFVRVKPMDLLFRGLLIDCTNVKDAAGKGVCAILKNNADNFVVLEENKYLFSVFGTVNGTISKQRFRVRRGMENNKDVGLVVNFEGEPTQSKWGEGRCNEINGTDGTIFAPFLTQKTVIRAFSASLCRVMEMTYEKPTVVKGIHTGHFTAGFGDVKSNKDQWCFCKDNEPENCPLKGTFDLSKCVGAPLVASLPHFYNGDKALLKGVDGLNPVKELHEIFLDFEMFTATPVQARSRLQFNMHLMSNEKIRLLNNFPNVLLPLVWVEEGVVLPDEMVGRVSLIGKVTKASKIIAWISIVAGIGLCLGGGYKKYLDNKNSRIAHITRPVSSKMNGQTWQLDAGALQSDTIPTGLDKN